MCVNNIKVSEKALQLENENKILMKKMAQLELNKSFVCDYSNKEKAAALQQKEKEVEMLRAAIDANLKLIEVGYSGVVYLFVVCVVVPSVVVWVLFGRHCCCFICTR